jgi:hypothetical protein
MGLYLNCKMETKAHSALLSSAKEDLTGHISGRFSPEDWQKILRLAEQKLTEYKASLTAADEREAWQAVVRDFHQNACWGFVPNYRPPRLKRKPVNLGIKFIIMAMMTMTVTKVAVVWLGQLQTYSDEPMDKWIFYAVVAVVVAGFGRFLWKNRHHRD